MANERLKKHLNFLFLNTTPEASAGSETWARVGKATEWTDTMNAKTETFDYIEDASPTEVIQNYQPSTSMPLTAYIGDPIYDFIFKIYYTQKTDTVTQSMRVFQNKDAGGAAQLAQKTSCTVKVDNFNIATGVITFNITQSGTPTLGTAKVTADAEGVYTPVFTPGVATP